MRIWATFGNLMGLVLQKICACCGLVAPIFTLSMILLAVGSYPQFSWSANALSDLGVVPGITSMLFNGGLVIGGFLTLLFALALYWHYKGFGDEGQGPARGKTLGVVGAILFFLTGILLMAIGVFTEEYRPAHYYVSVAFFVVFPISLFFQAFAHMKAGSLKMGALGMALGVLAGLVWLFQKSVGFGSGVAIPEFLAALCVSLWSLAEASRIVWKKT